MRPRSAPATWQYAGVSQMTLPRIERCSMALPTYGAMPASRVGLDAIAEIVGLLSGDADAVPQISELTAP